MALHMALEDTIGVGIIGANPERGWALRAHIPALRALPEFTIAALSTSRPQSAQAAAAVFGVANTYADHERMVADPAVDLVVVSVKVPAHMLLVSSALNAGKHVLCEWPLAITAADARALLALAKATGVRHVIGLQARMSPVIRYVKALVAEGYVGRLLSSTVIGSGRGWGAQTDRPSIYLRDPASGATMLSIPVGHFLDAFCDCLGDFAELDATLATQRRQITLSETGETIPATAADQIAIQGLLTSGALATVHYRGGLSRGTNFHWEINGTDGDLVMTAPTGHLQMEEVRLQGAHGADKALMDLPVPDRYIVAPEAPRGQPFNVAQLYAQFAKDLRGGGTGCAGFDVAVARHDLLETIMRAAATGQRQRL